MSEGFPNNPHDLERASGNEKKYVYNSEDDTWKNFGGVADYPLVSYDNDGLVYPDLYDRLVQIQESKNLKNLKLTEAKSYFYNFISTDKLVKFNVEKNNFRIELDKGAITRKLATMPCVGPRGPRGLQGKTGRNGVPAPNEKLRPVYQDGSFNLDVGTPLEDQPISLRGYKFSTEEFEALIFLNGAVSDPDKGLTKVELIGDPKSGKVTVKGTLTNPNLRFKIRQRGKDGESGKNGVNYLEVITDDVGANGRYTEVVGMFRYNSTLNSLIFKNTSVTELLSNVVNLVTSPDLTTKDYWASVEITSNLRKAVEYHQFTPALKAPLLDLPSYVPLSGCYNQRRYAMGYLQAPENVPFTMVTDPFPQYMSCKDPYWFCGNSGNNGGVCDGLIDVDPNRPNVPFETSSTSTSESTESSDSSISDSSDSEVSDSSDSEVSDSSDSEESLSSDSKSLSSDSDAESLSSDSEDSLSSDSEESLSSDSEESLSSDSEDSLSSDSEESLSSNSSDSEDSLSSNSLDESDSSASTNNGECIQTATLNGDCSGYESGTYEVIFGVPTITFLGGSFELRYYGSWVVTSFPNGCSGSYPCNDIYINFESSYDLFCSGSGPTVTINFFDSSYSCSGTISVP